MPIHCGAFGTACMNLCNCTGQIAAREMCSAVHDFSLLGWCLRVCLQYIALDCAHPALAPMSLLQGAKPAVSKCKMLRLMSNEAYSVLAGVPRTADVWLQCKGGGLVERLWCAICLCPACCIDCLLLKLSLVYPCAHTHAPERSSYA